jgi:hypothetical protein
MHTNTYIYMTYYVYDAVFMQAYHVYTAVVMQTAMECSISVRYALGLRFCVGSDQCLLTLLAAAIVVITGGHYCQ